MVFVGIDVAKETHECRILNEYDEDLCKVFSFKNTAKGFNELYEKILSVEPDISQVKVGLEATGHYSCSILNFLHNRGFCTGGRIKTGQVKMSVIQRDSMLQ